MKKMHISSGSLIVDISATEKVDHCGVRIFIELMGGKWKFHIYTRLLEKPRRYKHLLELIPEASEKMILTSLRELEEHRIVDRVVYNETPQRVEYKITDYGKSLKNVMKTIEKWGKLHIEQYPETVFFETKK